MEKDENTLISLVQVHEYSLFMNGKRKTDHRKEIQNRK